MASAGEDSGEAPGLVQLGTRAEGCGDGASCTPAASPADSEPAVADTVLATSPRADGIDDAAPLKPGDTLDRYEIQDVLGSGGMGLVYRARDRQLGRRVAIKVLRAAPPAGSEECQQLCSRLLREAQSMALLSHENLVTVYDVGTFHGRVYLVMEYVEGSTLGDWLDSDDRPWRERLDVLLAAARGLAAAHEAGVVHRDFKPDNVLVSSKGRVQVADFGLARSLADVNADREPASHCCAILLPSTDDPTQLTQVGAAVGTPRYMSPEQHQGRAVDARSDQFSFAVSTYEALYERAPFHGHNIAEIADAVIAGELIDPPRNTDVPRQVGDVLRRALAVDPDARFASMTELIDALAAAAEKRGLWSKLRGAFGGGRA